MQNYPAGTSELIPLAQTRIYVEILHYVDSVLLAQNYPAGTSELSPLGANSDLRINFTLRRNFRAGLKFWIYVEIVYYVEIFPLAQNSPVGASEWFPFFADLDLHRNFTLRKSCPSGTTEFIYSWRPLGSSLGVKIPRDSFSGVPLRFRWRLRINSFWRQIGSSLEFSCGNLGINSVWRQLKSPLGFAIPRDSFSGITPWFPPLGFTLLVCSWGTTFSPVGGLLVFSFLGELHEIRPAPRQAEGKSPHNQAREAVPIQATIRWP